MRGPGKVLEADTAAAVGIAADAAPADDQAENVLAVEGPAFVPAAAGTAVPADLEVTSRLAAVAEECLLFSSYHPISYVSTSIL